MNTSEHQRPDGLAARARQAYEWARLRFALRVGWAIAPLALLSFLYCQQPLACALIGAALLALATAFRWRGQRLGRAVTPGLALGSLGFALPLFMHLNGHGCQWGTCSGSCMTACTTLGLGLGVGLMLWAHKMPATQGLRPHPGALGLIAGCTAALGCLPMGLTGALVALLSTSLSSLTLATS